MPCIPWFLSIAYATGRTKVLALAAQMLNGAIRRMNHYPADKH